MEKLKEIIENIKSSIPFLNKSKEKSTEQDSQEEEETAIDHKFDQSDLEEDTETVEASDQKPELSESDKKRKNIIMLIVVMGIAIFLFGPEEEVSSNKDNPNINKVSKKLKKNKKKSKDIESINQAKEVANQKDNLEDQVSETEFIIPDEKTIADEEVGDFKAPEKLSDLTNFEAKEKIETSPKKIVKKETAKSPFEEVPMVQDLNTNTRENGRIDLKKNEETNISAFDKISEKLSEELDRKKGIKVNYEALGRGLAYNCELGYWVCLNKEEFLNCRENLKWANKLGNKKECVPHDVYAGIKDCQIMQVHNINTNSTVGFCN